MIRGFQQLTPAARGILCKKPCTTTNIDQRFLSYITSPPNERPPFRAAVELSSSAIPGSAVTLAGWHTLPATYSLLQAAPNPSFSVKSLPSQEDAAAKVQALCSGLPLHKVQLLPIAFQFAPDLADPETTSDYVRLFEHFPAAAHIELESECAATDVECVLSALLRTTAGSTRPLCPELRELHIEGDHGLASGEDSGNPPTSGLAYFVQRRLQLERRFPKRGKVLDLGGGLVCTFE